MPIRGLTDYLYTPAEGLPKLGTLNKGGTKREVISKKTNKPVEIVGEDLTYFRFEPEPQFEYLRPIWEGLYGAEPECFSTVYIAGNTVDEAFPTWMVEHSATKLLHRCDGETQVEWWNGRHVSQEPVACVASDGGCKCKRTGRLKLLFPELLMETGALGYIAMMTHSFHDIIAIHKYLSAMLFMHGGITGIPFTLGRAPKEVSAPNGNGKEGDRIKVEKSLLYLYAQPDYAKNVLLPAMTAAPQLQLVNTTTGEIVGRPALPARTMTNGGGNGNGGSQHDEDEPPADVVSWVTEDALQVLFGRIYAGVAPDATLVDIARWAGIEHALNLDDWRVFETRTDAAIAIKAGFDAEQLERIAGADSPDANEDTDDEADEPTEITEITDEVRSARYQKKMAYGSLRGVVILETNSGTTIEIVGRDRLRKLSPEWKAYVETWTMGKDGAGNRYEFMKAEPPMMTLVVTYNPTADQYKQLIAVELVTIADIPF